MKPLLITLALFAPVAPALLAQDSTPPEDQETPEEVTPPDAEPEPPRVVFQRHFDEGMKALEAGDHAAGIDAFERCLEAIPESPVPAYNIACAHALEKRTDEAFAWLEKASTWGYGVTRSNIDHAEKSDPDLASLRDDERFRPFIDGMRKNLVALEEYAAKESREAAVHVPEALADATSVGALVVLHDSGGTKSRTLEAWKGHADRLGLVLIAPSGKFHAGGRISDGMNWFSAFPEFRARYWKSETPIELALEAVGKDRSLDPERTFVVGVGQGAMVAFNAAVRKPTTYAGVLAVDGLPLPQLVQTYAGSAQKAGLRVGWVANTKLLWGVRPSETVHLIGSVSEQIERSGLALNVLRYAPKVDAPNLREERIVEALDALTRAPKPSSDTPDK